jgi:hypothetical protein
MAIPLEIHPLVINFFFTTMITSILRIMVHHASYHSPNALYTAFGATINIGRMVGWMVLWRIATSTCQLLFFLIFLPQF